MNSLAVDRRVLSWPVRYAGNISVVKATVIIALVSFGLKTLYITMFGGGFTALPTESDVYFYDGAARVLLEHGVYGLDPDNPTISMPPGQSVFLSLLYTLGAGSVAFVKFAHVALMTLVAVVTYLTGRLLMPPSVAFWAGLLVAVDPAHTYLAATFLSEPLFILFMVLGVYWLVREREKEDTLWRPVVAGLCFAIAGLTRNQGWPFPMFILFGAIITGGRLISRRTALLTALFALLLVAPWTYRNYRVSGEFVPISAEGGLTFWASNNSQFSWRPPMPMSLPVYTAPDGLSATELDKFYWNRALEWIQDNPTAFVRNGLRKFLLLYHFDPMPQRSEMNTLMRIAGIFPYGLLLPFIFLGFVQHLRDPKFWLLGSYVIYTTALALLFFGDSRIRAPIQPYLYLFAMAWLLPRLQDWLEANHV